MLCNYLAKDDVKLTVADIDPERVREIQERYGAVAVDTAEIHRAAADVFVPCAMGAGLNDTTIPEIKAAIVAGSANNQLAEGRHGIMLKGHGILYAPDYVINAGGVIDVASEGPDYDPSRVMEKVERIYHTLGEIFMRAQLQDTAPEIIADRMAEERFLGSIDHAA